MNNKQILAFLSAALLGGQASAFWRMECRGVSGEARLDPLVNPGAIGSHAHEVFGSGGFASTASYESLIDANCTSCAVTEDKSAYWTPIPYFKDDSTGKFEEVKNVGGMLAYYFLNSAPSGNQTIQAFPQGFRMIAGETTRRNYTVGDGDYESPDPPKSEWAGLGQTNQDDLSQRALGFNCLDYTKDAEGSLYRHFMPSKDYIDANCPDGIRFELMFPTCWDGVNLDSDDHKSHVAYPDLVMSGDCPEDFPVRLPGLFFETIWDMGGFSDRKGIFAMSNGDPLGFGYHGDFIMGWDETGSFRLQDAVDTCTNLSGEIQDCPLFTIQDEATQKECKFDLPSELVDDLLEGPLDSLPGGVGIAWGPGPATEAHPEQPSTSVVLPTLTYSAGSTASVNGSYVPGNAFVGVTSTSGTPAASAVPVGDAVKADVGITSAASADSVSATATATSYLTSTNSAGLVIINEVVYEEVITYVTESTTTTVYQEPSAPAVRRRGGHQHRHVHGRAH
ncbi:hypothetical protein VMCG_10258 [Cytospora schulzeri]|uniref:DUF1996 domain-containing protein n=1 Tax=Cytospora schulzeri TaxID=448051 RepID=A0A423VH08_9PEZI|nr:hypothetical protein VMCG_10258 [Valsa malicola]